MRLHVRMIFLLCFAAAFTGGIYAFATAQALSTPHASAAMELGYMSIMFTGLGLLAAMQFIRLAFSSTS